MTAIIRNKDIIMYSFEFLNGAKNVLSKLEAANYAVMSYVFN